MFEIFTLLSHLFCAKCIDRNLHFKSEKKIKMKKKEKRAEKKLFEKNKEKKGNKSVGA